MYPPTSELSVTVSASDSSGLISSTAFPASQSDAFFNLRNNGSYTTFVEASHDTTGPSIPKTISLTSMYDMHDIVQVSCNCNSPVDLFT